MRENELVDRFTCRYIANLLTGFPGVLRKSIDIGELLEAIRRRLDRAAKRELCARIDALANVPRENRRALTQKLLGKSSVHGRQADDALRHNHRSCGLVLAEALARYAGEAASVEESVFGKRLSDLASSLGLSTIERDTLALIHLSEVRAGFFADALYESAIWDLKNLRDYLPAMLNVPASVARTLLSGDSPLMRLQLIECGGLSWRPTTPSSVDSFLGGTSDSPTFEEHVFERVEPNRFAGRPLNVSEEDWKLLCQIVSRLTGCNILLSGAAGTGKTSLAKALAAHMGLTPLLIKSPADADRNARVGSILVALRIAERTPGRVVIIDEAEQVLCTAWSWSRWGQRSDKGWLNKLLEERRSKVIWIANEVQGAETSTLRRFCYALDFQPFSSRQRLALWKDVLTSYPGVDAELSGELVEGLARKFELQPGQISDVVRITSAVMTPEAGARPTLERLLRSHQQRLTGKLEAEGVAFAADVGGGRYSLDGLNADQDLRKLTETIGRFAARRWPEAGGAAVVEGPRNFNVLLSGPPGTGKTEFAKFLARTLDRELVVRTASQLHSKWVGETEKNIAAAFAEAEAEHGVLFIDEADSFLWGREGATASWQVSEVNEFLCRMERFQGILVCATNFLDRFDQAAMRRFGVKVRFDWLAPAGKLAFWDRVLAPLLGAGGSAGAEGLSEAETKMLAAIPKLTPGDFKVVRQKYELQDRTELTARELLAELEAETRYKAADGGWGRPVGFLV